MVDPTAKPDQPKLNFQGRRGWKIAPHSQAGELSHSTVTVDGWCSEGGLLSQSKSLQSLWKLSFLEVYMNSYWNDGKNSMAMEDSPGTNAPVLFITLPKPQDALRSNWFLPPHRGRLGQHHSFIWNLDLYAKTSLWVCMPLLTNGNDN